MDVTDAQERGARAVNTLAEEAVTAADAVSSSFQGLTEGAENLPQFFRRAALAGGASTVIGTPPPPSVVSDGGSAAGASGGGGAGGGVVVNIDNLNVPARDPFEFFRLLMRFVEEETGLRTGAGVLGSQGGMNG